MFNNLAANFLRGRKCIHCGSYKVYRLASRQVKCRICRRTYSPSKLKRDLDVLQYFALEASANRAARDLELNYRTVQKRYMALREKIAEYSDDNLRKLCVELGTDLNFARGGCESKQRQGEIGNAMVFGILEHSGLIYSNVIPNAKPETVMREIMDKTENGSVYHSKEFKSHRSLKLYGKHNQINKDTNNPKDRARNNIIDLFWNFAKERLDKYRGINKQNYPLYMKEMEFRFNNRKNNLSNELIKIIYAKIGKNPA